MPSVNPIILDTLRKMISEDPSIPDEIESIVKKLLEIESVTGTDYGGIEKLYDKVLKEYVEDNKINEWSKNYAG